MNKLDLLYEGKAKQIYQTDDSDILWVQYKDSATAFNNIKKAKIAGKGRLNNEISSLLFTLLQAKGIRNHFIKKISPTEQLVQKVTIIPIEVVVRNVATGSLVNRLGVGEGTIIAQPIVEFYLKDDALGDPLINDDHIAMLALATPEQLTELRQMSLAINHILLQHFTGLNVKLIDFKLEFGIRPNGEVILADEISPDTCRLWDALTDEKLDKDIFRQDLGDLVTAYQEILQRLGGKTSDV